MIGALNHSSQLLTKDGRPTTSSNHEYSHRIAAILTSWCTYDQIRCITNRGAVQMGKRDKARGREADDIQERSRRDELLEWRRVLTESSRQTSQQFDKFTLTLSAGALAISLTFVRELAQQPTLGSVVILGISWMGYIACICSTMASFQLSNQSTNREIEIIDSELRGDSDVDDRNSFGRLTELLNWLSLISFVISTLLLISFALANVRGKT